VTALLMSETEGNMIKLGDDGLASFIPRMVIMANVVAAWHILRGTVS
jgi:hypothetical protein